MRKILLGLSLALVAAFGIGGVGATPALAADHACYQINYGVPSWVSGHFQATIAFDNCVNYAITSIDLTADLFANSWPAGFGERYQHTYYFSPPYTNNYYIGAFNWANYCPAPHNQWWGWVPSWVVHWSDGTTSVGSGPPSSGWYGQCAP